MSLVKAIAKEISLASKVFTPVDKTEAAAAVRLISDSLFDMVVSDASSLTVKHFGIFKCKTSEYHKNTPQHLQVDSINFIPSKAVASALKDTYHSSFSGDNHDYAIGNAANSLATLTLTRKAMFSCPAMVDVLRNEGYTKEFSRKMVDIYFATILETIARNRMVRVPSIGVFKVIHRKGETGITGKKVLYSHAALAFRPYNSSKVFTRASD